MRSLFTLGLLGCLAFAAVGQDATKSQAIKVVELDRKEPVLYDKDIEPFLVKKCLVCHGGQVKEGKFDLTSYDSMLKGGKRGKPFIPGKGHESLIYKLAGKTEKPFMPPKGETPLSPEELALLKLWIDQGAKAPATVRVRPTAIVNLPSPLVNPVRAVALNPDKTLVVAGRGNQIHVFDKDGNHVRNLVQPGLTTPDKKPVEAAHLSIVEAVAFSPDGKLAASGGYQEIILWDADDGEVKLKLAGFTDRVVALAFSPDGKMLATGGGPPTEDGEIKIIDVDSGKVMLDIKNCHSDTVFGVSFSPDGKMLATAGGDKYVKVWDMPSGKFLKSFEGHTHHVLDVGWKSDGKLLASAAATRPPPPAPASASSRSGTSRRASRSAPSRRTTSR